MEHLPTGGTEAQRMAAEMAADTLVRDADGQVQPRYVFMSRPAGRLACSELVIEPTLGRVRVVDVRPTTSDGSDFVHVAWSDEYGPCRAAGRYSADRLFAVRAPDREDRLLVRQGIDQAAWQRREISGTVARLIAAHLHRGRETALYGFAVNGAVREQLYDELDAVSRSQPAFRSWASALASYCLGRGDTGPVPGWGPRPQDSVRRPQPAPVIEPAVANARQRTAAKPRHPLTAKRIPAETALKLMDAAFALGVEASQSRKALAKAHSLVQQHAEGRSA